MLAGTYPLPQVPMWRVAWSFYAGAVGAWVITGPATYSPWAGVIGMVFYAVASGLPVLMIAYAGDVIQVRRPRLTAAGQRCAHPASGVPCYLACCWWLTCCWNGAGVRGKSL